MSGQYIGISDCYGCGKVFEFDLDTVLTIWVDPKTNIPPDVVMDADGNPVQRRIFDAASQAEYDAANARAVQKPICPDCRKKADADRARAGKGPIR